MTVHRLYGTYLMHLVEKIIREHDPQTVKDIARHLHVFCSERQQRNLEKRVRTSLRMLESENIIVRQPHLLDGNILIYHYKIASQDGGTQERQGLS